MVRQGNNMVTLVNQSLFIVIIKLPYTLLLILFFMTRPSTLKLIVIIFELKFSPRSLSLITLATMISHDQLTDIFTKSLSTSHFHPHYGGTCLRACELVLRLWFVNVAFETDIVYLIVQGYPTATNDPPTRKKFQTQTKKKGDRGFIEGCLFALCCCWLCEECF
ncbi:hypothetical protein ACLB2K_063313 [Fragaria x ananassa]